MKVAYLEAELHKTRAEISAREELVKSAKSGGTLLLGQDDEKIAASIGKYRKDIGSYF